MKVRELINELLDEDLDDDVDVETVDIDGQIISRSIDGISPDSYSRTKTGIVLIVLD